MIIPIQHSLKAQETLVDTDPLKLFNNAVELYENQMFQAAIQAFRDYSANGDQYILKARSDFLIALSAKELNLPNTEAFFLSYLEKYPEQKNDNTVYFELGKFYFYKKKFENALEWLSKLNNPRGLISAEQYEYYYMTGYCYFKEKKYDKAQTAFSRIDENNNPFFAFANYYKGYIYYIQDKPDEALKRFLKIEKDEKFTRILPAYITHIYLNQKKYNDVISYGEKSLQTPKIERANDIKAYMAESYFRLKEYDKAMTFYKELYDGGYKFSESDCYNYGFALFKNSNYKQALAIFSNIPVKENELGQNISFLMGTSYLLTEDKYKARNSFLFAARLNFDQNIKEISSLNYAKLSYELGFDKEAISSLEKFVSDFPGSSYTDDAQNLLSQILQNTDNYKDAIAVIERLKQRNTSVDIAYQKLTYFYGLEFFQNRNYKTAKEYFIKSIKVNNDRKFTALAYFWLGESYYKLNEIENAQREYKNFLYVTEAKKTPYFSTGYYNLGYTYLKQENFAEAKACFSKFITLEDGNTKTIRYADAYVRLADCYFALKEYNNAITYFNEVINRNGQDVDYSLYQKAIILGLQGKDNEKLESLRILTTRYSGSPYMDDGLFEIANMHFISGDYVLAQTKFNYLIQEFPKSPYYLAALLKVGLADYNLNKTEQALSRFSEIINKYPYSSEAREAFKAAKEIYEDMGKAEEVFKLMPSQSLTQSFQDSTTYNSAFSHVRKGNYAEAISSLEKYLQKFPNGYFAINAHYYLATCALYLNRRELALENFEEVIQKSPNEFVEKSLKNAAELYYLNSSYEKALQAFTQLEEIAATQENTMLAMMGQMRCHFKLGEFEQTIQIADKILNMTSVSRENKTEAYYYNGKAEFELQKYDLALPAFKQVIDNNNADLGAESKYLTAYIYFLKENYDGTIDQVLELKDKFSNNDYYVAKGFILLADVLVRTGDLFQAKATLQSIIDNYQGSDLKKIAEQKLAEIKIMEDKNSSQPENDNENEQ